MTLKELIKHLQYVKDDLEERRVDDPEYVLGEIITTLERINRTSKAKPEKIETLRSKEVAGEATWVGVDPRIGQKDEPLLPDDQIEQIAQDIVLMAKRAGLKNLLETLEYLEKRT